MLEGLEMGFLQNKGRVTNRGQVWVPAAAVIPTLLVYFNVAAFKTFVVYVVNFFFKKKKRRGPKELN